MSEDQSVGAIQRWNDPRHPAFWALFVLLLWTAWNINSIMEAVGGFP